MDMKCPRITNNPPLRLQEWSADLTCGHNQKICSGFLTGWTASRVYMFILLSCLFAVFSGGCRTIDPEIMREEERLLQAVRINPAHEMGYLRYAQFLERQGRFRETLMVLRKGRQRVPDSILMIRLEGSLIQHLQSRESALEFYDAQLTRRPDQPNLLLDRAHLLLRMERTEPALAEVKKALGLDPDLFEAHYLAGIIHSRRKEHEKAVDAFISASRIQEDHPELWSRIAAMWEKLGEPRKARAAIRKALDHDPESFLFLQQYATLLESALDEDDPETIAELRAAIRQLLWLGPEDSWVLAHAGFLAWHDGDFEEAETLLKQALAVQSPYPWASFRLGTVYMSRKQWRRALLSFQEGLEGQPESPWAFRQIGLAYEMLGDAAKAIEHYELVLDRDSKNLPLLIRLTNLYWDEFRFSDVERVLNKGLSEFPRNLELLNLLLKYHQSRGQFEPAVALLRSSAKIHPDNMMVLSRLGEFELQLGHYQSAREWFRRALKNKPRHPMLWMQLIQIDLLEKQDDSAEKKLLHLLELEPDSEWGLAQTARLKLRGNELDAAEMMTSRGLSRHPGSVTLLKVKGLIDEERRMWPDAINTFQKIDSLQPGDPLIMTHLGMLHEINGDPELSRKLLEGALSSAGGNLWAFFLIALQEKEPIQRKWFGPEYTEIMPVLDSLLHRRFAVGWKQIQELRTGPVSRQALKNLYFLLQDVQGRIALNPAELTSGSIPPWIRYLWGHIYETRKEYLSAQSHFLSVLQDFPDEPWLHARLGVVYEKTGDKATAAVHYQLCLERYPGAFWVLLRRAIVSMYLENEAEAISLYKQLLELSPDHALSLNNLAWMYLTAQDRSLRNTTEALKLAERAVSEADTIDHIDTLAEAYFQSGNPAKAIKTLRKGARSAHYPKSRERYLKLQYERFRAGNTNTSPPPES